MTETPLTQLKKQYDPLKKKYALPTFEDLNNEFAIEKIQEGETECLLREIRIAIARKISYFNNVLEAFMNPQRASMFFLAIADGMNEKDKKLIEKLYDKICSLELEWFALDSADYNEKAEAETIKEALKKWNTIKDDLKKFATILKRIWKEKTKE